MSTSCVLLSVVVVPPHLSPPICFVSLCLDMHIVEFLEIVQWTKPQRKIGCNCRRSRMPWEKLRRPSASEDPAGQSGRNSELTAALSGQHCMNRSQKAEFVDPLSLWMSMICWCWSVVIGSEFRFFSDWVVCSTSPNMSLPPFRFSREPPFCDFPRDSETKPSRKHPTTWCKNTLCKPSPWNSNTHWGFPLPRMISIGEDRRSIQDVIARWWK